MPIVSAKDRKDAARIAKGLLRAAGSEAHLVRTVTYPTYGFDVPQSVLDKYEAGDGEFGEVEQAQNVEQPTASTDNGTADVEQAAAATADVEQAAAADAAAVDAATEQAGDPVEPELVEPDGNDTTETWTEFVRKRWNYAAGTVEEGGVDGLKRRELIELHRQNLADAADAEQ